MRRIYFILPYLYFGLYACQTIEVKSQAKQSTNPFLANLTGEWEADSEGFRDKAWYFHNYQNNNQEFISIWNSKQDYLNCYPENGPGMGIAFPNFKIAGHPLNVDNPGNFIQSMEVLLGKNEGDPSGAIPKALRDKFWGYKQTVFGPDPEISEECEPGEILKEGCDESQLLTKRDWAIEAALDVFIQHLENDLNEQCKESPESFGSDATFDCQLLENIEVRDFLSNVKQHSCLMEYPLDELDRIAKIPFSELMFCFQSGNCRDGMVFRTHFLNEADRLELEEVSEDNMKLKSEKAYSSGMQCTHTLTSDYNIQLKQEDLNEFNLNYIFSSSEICEDLPPKEDRESLTINYKKVTRSI